MTENEKVLLAASLKYRVNYVEFGAGGSTLFALQSGVSRCYSVESDIKWVETLRSNADIGAAEQDGRLRIHHADIGETGPWGAPKDRSKICAWPAYYMSIWELAGRNVDLVLIDGRFRAACACAAFLATNPETPVLVHDFYDRTIDRSSYGKLLELASIDKQADNLVSLKRKPFIDAGAVMRVLQEVWCVTA